VVKVGWMVVMLGVGCVSPTAAVVEAREACRDWMMGMRIGERPEMGSMQWGAALRQCTRLRVSAAGRIALALDEAVR
jgi:hypothetical protein